MPALLRTVRVSSTASVGFLVFGGNGHEAFESVTPLWLQDASGPGEQNDTVVILPNLPATFTPATPYTRDTQQPSYTSGDLVPLGPVQQDALQPTTLHLQGGLPRVNNGDGQHSSGWTQQATSCKDLGSINRLMDGVLRGHQQVLQPSHAIQLQKNFG